MDFWEWSESNTEFQEWIKTTPLDKTLTVEEQVQLLVGKANEIRAREDPWKQYQDKKNWFDERYCDQTDCWCRSKPCCPGPYDYPYCSCDRWYHKPAWSG